MIYFDEKTIAEQIHDTQSFVKGFSVSELAIYAKWLRYKRGEELGKDVSEFTADENLEVDESIEEELKYLCERAYPNYNYTVDYEKIDSAIAISRKYKLKVPTPTPITAKEWEIIQSIDNDDYRRILFVALVDAKYYSKNHTTIGTEYDETNIKKYWSRLSYPEIIKLAKTTLRKKREKNKVWYYLYHNGFMGITPKPPHVPYVNIVDNYSDVIDYVTDYEHIDLHYERLMGEKIGQCKYCGRLFRQSAKNNGSYCYKHRGYRKVGLRFAKCVDCGKEFSVTSNNHKKIRCDSCQTRYREKYKKNYYLNKNN